MSFTRYHDDPCRIQKQLQEFTGPGRYMLNKPGQGEKPNFMEDPYIRLQEWGANLMTNCVDVESNLKGLSQLINKDCIPNNEYIQSTVKSSLIKSYTAVLHCLSKSKHTHVITASLIGVSFLSNIVD